MSAILLIEDEEVLSKNIRRALEKLGHEVWVAATGAEGERLFVENRPDLTLLDLRLPDADGLEILERLRKLETGSSIIMMTAYASVEDAVRAIKLGARDYLQKPLHLDDLKHAVERALHEARLQQEVSYFRQRESRDAEIDSLLGSCPAMEQLRGRIRRLCSLPATTAPPTVLLRGETGTGKGMIARVLHYNGARARGPFIEVNCAAIAENLVEAELFGHERGAFTDAKTSKPGLFQAADGGTLFLDEIGCLGLAVQSKILKAIEEKKIRPVGGRMEKTVDIQIVAATNAPLEEMIESGSFREDLFYRLQVAPLTVPPLRDRGDDVLVLARHFLTEITARYRQPARFLTADAERAIQCYAWPGNVRELRNVLDRTVLFSEEEGISAATLGLPHKTSAPVANPAAVCPPDGALRLEIPDEGIRFEEIERSLIVAALQKSGGNKTEAARLLGLSRDTLRYRIEKLAIPTK